MAADSLALVLDDIGRTIRAVRLAVRWTQRELARRSAVAQGEISRIERGQFAGLSVAVLDRLCVALGIRYSVTWMPPQTAPRQRDAVHAWCSAYVARRLGPDWIVEREVEVGGDRSRGWVDLVAYHRGSRTILVTEIKTEIHDVGEIERQVNWYEREARLIGRARAWDVGTVHSALLVLESEANDAAIRRSVDVFGLAFPGRAKDLKAVIEGAVVAARRAVAMIDPRSRRAAWLRATRVDGRRTAAAYRDYADAARTLEASARARRRPSSPR